MTVGSTGTPRSERLGGTPTFTLSVALPITLLLSSNWTVTGFAPISALNWHTIPYSVFSGFSISNLVIAGPAVIVPTGPHDEGSSVSGWPFGEMPVKK